MTEATLDDVCARLTVRLSVSVTVALSCGEITEAVIAEHVAERFGGSPDDALPAIDGWSIDEVFLDHGDVLLHVEAKEKDDDC